MVGLILLVAAAVYLVFLFWATRAAYRWGKKRDFTTRGCWLAGAGGFLVVYLPMFWDYIPTLIAHQYYCEKEGGFQVYKTLEQWRNENPRAAEKLSPYPNALAHRNGDADNYTDTYELNDRFNWVVKKSGPSLLNLWRHEQQVVDRQKGEVLARYIDFSSGYGNFMLGTRYLSAYKFWLSRSHCASGDRYLSKFRNFRRSTESLGGSK